MWGNFDALRIFAFIEMFKWCFQFIDDSGRVLSIVFGMKSHSDLDDKALVRESLECRWPTLTIRSISFLLITPSLSWSYVRKTYLSFSRRLPLVVKAKPMRNSRWSIVRSKRVLAAKEKCPSNSPTIPSLFSSKARWISAACFWICSSLPLLILRRKLTVSALEIFPFGQAS